jgi:pimeloyl-ACP methyl ester carboxylesterase
MRRRAALFAAGLVTATLLGACSAGPSPTPDLVTAGGAALVTTSAATPRPTGPGGPGRTSSPLDWGSCDSAVSSTDPGTGQQFSIDCSSLIVPAEYDPNAGRSGRITLQVARARADGVAADAPTLVVLRGEPGEYPADRIAAVAASLPQDVTAHFAVVTLDLRGTGSSSPVVCVSGDTAGGLLALGPNPATESSVTLLSNLARQLSFDCGDAEDTDLTRFNTVAAADDLDTLRAALGDDALNFYGEGHGATLGAVYAERYPGRVRQMVLDAPADPKVTPSAAAAAAAIDAESAFDTFATACAGFDGGCPLGVDPRTTVQQLVTTLGDTGVPAAGVDVTGGTVLTALRTGLGNPASWPQLAAALAAAVRGDTEQIGSLVLADAGAPDVDQALSARLVFGCNDVTERLNGTSLQQAAAASKQKAPLFGPFWVSLVGLCGGWPAPTAAAGAITANGAPPIVVLGAVQDPVAAYSSVQSLAAGMSSAVLLSWQSPTHGSYPASPCVTDLVNGYLLRGAVPKTGQVCPA